MSDRIKLDDSSYNSIYEKAMKQIELQAPWWTHREISDPGITLVEMWALLCDMQSFYLDQIQESHYRKYLKLLGIVPDEGESASVWVSFYGVTEPTVLPEGTKLLADKMVFETGEETMLTANRLTAFYLGKEDSLTDGKNLINIMNRPRKARFQLYPEDPLFSFELSDAVAEGEILNFYVLLDERGGRTPGGYMTELSWEYLTNDGYREARVVRDDTHGLLYSGRISMSVEEPAKKRENGGYPIRCRIKKGTFDVIPVIYNISLNVAQAFQKNTLCSEEYFSFSCNSSKRTYIPLKSYLALTGELQVYIKCGEDEWEEFTQFCEIAPPVTSHVKERYIYFDEERFGRMPVEGDRTIKLVCSVAGFREEYEPCSITGVSAQQIPLQWENMMRGSTKLMLRQKNKSTKFWQYRLEEPEEDRYRFAWHWQEEKNVIELGDGRHGDIPMAAEDGLRLTSLVLWEGEKGNTAIGKIRGFERGYLFPGITCCNLMTGAGGRDRKKPSEQFAGIRNKFCPINRMVTREDIRRLALETPGLILKDVKAEWKDGKISVTLFPINPLEEYCKEKYRKAVMAHLEQYRLITGRIEVKVE